MIANVQLLARHSSLVWPSAAFLMSSLYLIAADSVSCTVLLLQAGIWGNAFLSKSYAVNHDALMRQHVSENVDV